MPQQVHLYSDGGLDISADGNRLLTCAQLLVQKNTARNMPITASYGGVHNWSPLSHTERLLGYSDSRAAATEDDEEEQSLPPPRTRTVVECVPDYRVPSTETEVYENTVHNGRNTIRRPSSAAAAHLPLRMSNGIMARYAYAHPTMQTTSSFTASSHCIMSNQTSNSSNGELRLGRDKLHSANKTTGHIFPQFRFAFPGSRETASLAGMCWLFNCCSH